MAKFDPWDADAIQPYFSGRKQHKNYKKALDVYWHLEFHIDGYFKRPWVASGNVGSIDRVNITNPYFERLIDARRPNESPTILGYRRNIYKPMSKAPISAVISSLEKIFKASDYQPQKGYARTTVPKFLSGEDSLETYCEENFPFFDSITNWAEGTLLKWTCLDPNALCVVMPKTYELEQNEMYKPVTYIIQCQDVYEYKEDDYAIFLSPNKRTYIDEQGIEKTSRILCILTTDAIYEATQVGGSIDDFEIELKMQHNIGSLPAWILGGESKSPDGTSPFYESFLHPMLADLDELAAVSSDKSAELVQHMYSEKWYIMMTTCKACNGSGWDATLKDGNQIVCPTCFGRGGIPHEPYQDIVINPKNAMGQEVNVPIPPAGYIEKNTDIIEYLNDEISMRWKCALCAVKMPFLFENPMSKEKESGLAKSYDQSETNNFVYKVAHTLIKSIRNAYYYINEIRYGLLVPNKKERESMVPDIPVPRNYDMITTAALEQNMKDLAASNVSSIVKKAQEMDYLHIKYPDSTLRDQLQLEQDFDPFPDASIDEKLAMENADTIDKLDLCLSNYIADFTKELISQDSTFIDWEYEKQREKYYEMAQTKLELIKSKKEPDTQGATMSLNGGTMSSIVNDGIPPIVPANDDALYNQTLTTPIKQENAKASPDEVPSKKERNDLEYS